ncbi:MAG: transcription antitermination factor NusB [Deltaproteobacteria bacterium]|nr:transcription antitermination factor NusB [Deltaproteobacteria bacterium]
MGVRRKARENALKMLFACEMGKHPVDWVIDNFWEYFESNSEGREFADLLVRGTVDHLKEIDKAIQSVSIHWKITRMASVDRNILRMAAFELFHVKEVPKRVTLNEAIEIAKRFGTEDSWAFINGILDKLAGVVD